MRPISADGSRIPSATASLLSSGWYLPRHSIQHAFLQLLSCVPSVQTEHLKGAWDPSACKLHSFSDCAPQALLTQLSHDQMCRSLLEKLLEKEDSASVPSGEAAGEFRAPAITIESQLPAIKVSDSL